MREITLILRCLDIQFLHVMCFHVLAQGVTLRPTGYLLTKYDGLSPIPNCLLNKPNICEYYNRVICGPHRESKFVPTSPVYVSFPFNLV